MNRAFLLLAVLLSGCGTAIPKYNYQSQANTDPAIVFGDRFGGGTVNSPARAFAVNTKDAESNKCADFEEVGTTSNHWMRVSPQTIQINTPAGKAVAIRGNYLYSSGIIITTCTPTSLIFFPKDAAIYSVDIEITHKQCQFSVVQKLPNGQQEKIEGITILPNCKAQ
jgi:hypothetical protein